MTDKSETISRLSLCKNCNCMTNSKEGYIYICDKCGKDKRQYKEKETFENLIDKYKQKFNHSKKSLDYQYLELDEFDLNQIQQLHDQSIHNCAVNLDSKDKEIAELQAENEKLKKVIYCNENLKEISCGEERIHFSKQHILRLKKELNDISEIELNELNEFDKKGND